jgi:uncharacterized membrane protein (UPF0127 family)
MEKHPLVSDTFIEVADTPWKRAVGLMFRKEPSSLLIEFDREARHAIWMLFMRFPIDLIFLDSEKTVVTIYENIEPLSLDPRTWKIYRPKKRAKYALEVEAGWVKEKSVSPGDDLSHRC